MTRALLAHLQNAMDIRKKGHSRFLFTSQSIDKRLVARGVKEGPSFQRHLGNVLFDDTEKYFGEVKTNRAQSSIPDPTTYLKRFGSNEGFNAPHFRL